MVNFTEVIIALWLDTGNVVIPWIWKLDTFQSMTEETPELHINVGFFF